MRSFLGDCWDNYKEDFKDDWMPDANNTEEVNAAYGKIKESYDKSFVFLSKSVISGEYIMIDDVDNMLDAFMGEAMVESNPSVTESTPRVYLEYKKYCGSLAMSLKWYRSLISVAQDKFSVKASGINFGFARMERLDSKDPLSDFINLVIPVCMYDYSLPVKDSDFENFIILRTRVNVALNNSRAEIRPIYNLLLLKCNFIIRRIKSKVFSYKNDFKDETVIPSSLELGDYSNLLPPDKPSSNNTAEDCINEDDAPLMNYVELMRHYLKTVSSPEDVDKLNVVINRFNDRRDRDLGKEVFLSQQTLQKEYDSFSSNTIMNYLHNCRFSFMTKKCGLTLDEIKRELEKIKDIQHTTNINNYHPYEKAIEAVFVIIKGQLGKQEYDEVLLTDAFSELGRLITTYNDCIEWGKSRRFFPYQLPYRESIFHSDDYDMDLFIPSAYAKHIDYAELDGKLQQYKKDLDGLRLKIDLGRERNDIERIKQDIKNTDKKAYDLIALFTAVLTFLFGVVNVFTSATTSDVGVLVAKTIGLGVMLTLFMSLYLLVSPWLIQRIEWKHYFKTFRFWVGCLLVLVYMAVSFCLSLYYSTHSVAAGETQTSPSIELQESMSPDR